MAGFGGYCGRALRAHDVMFLGPARSGPPLTASQPRWDAVIRVIVEPQFAAICERPWKIGHESNRMAWRLRGEPPAHASGGIDSRGVFPGMVQLPPSGEPIVLAADAQTTGGYPIAGTVVEDDLWKLAQAALGSSVHFVAV
jgi:allophanate hydrolase subunit 2